MRQEELKGLLGRLWDYLPEDYWDDYCDYLSTKGAVDRCASNPKILACTVLFSLNVDSEEKTQSLLDSLNACLPGALGLYLQGILEIEMGRMDAGVDLLQEATANLDSADSNLCSIQYVIASVLGKVETFGRGFKRQLKNCDATMSASCEQLTTILADPPANLLQRNCARIQSALAPNLPFFEIIVTGLRLGDFFEECLASIEMQSYEAYRVHLLSDMDPENSIDAAFQSSRAYQFSSEPVVKAVSTRVGKAAIIYEHLIDFEFGENSVIVILDGDDRFASAEALKVFAEKYQSENPDACWSTYIRSDGFLGHSAPLIKGFDHRRQGWKSSHCFTFRASLIKQIPREYILDEFGNPVMQACDVALALPILDLAQRTSFIPEALYYYEVSNPESHHNQHDGVGLTSKRQMETARYLYCKTPLIRPK